jgi:predicted nucleotidyltransferase
MDLDYLTIFRELNKQKIDYLVVGGLAVNFHGIPRMTYDIDLMILLDPLNIRRMVLRLLDWGYRPGVPVNPEDLADEVIRTSWIKEKGMRALNFYHESQPIGAIDLVRERAIIIELQGEKIPVVSIHDLIKLKMKAGRKQDLSDVEHLKKILEK